MNRDDVIRWAREAGLPSDELYRPNLERFAALIASRVAAAARAEEREAAEERVTDLFADMETPYLPDIVSAIRARGNATSRELKE